MWISFNHENFLFELRYFINCPIILALCLMLLVTFYALNYVGIIDQSLISAQQRMLEMLVTVTKYVHTLL